MTAPTLNLSSGGVGVGSPVPAAPRPPPRTGDEGARDDERREFHQRLYRDGEKLYSPR